MKFAFTRSDRSIAKWVYNQSEIRHVNCRFWRRIHFSNRDAWQEKMFVYNRVLRILQHDWLAPPIQKWCNELSGVGHCRFLRTIVATIDLSIPSSPCVEWPQRNLQQLVTSICWPNEDDFPAIRRDLLLVVQASPYDRFQGNDQFGRCTARM